MFGIDGDFVPPCRQTNPELWFSGYKSDIKRAKALCATCRIQLLCLENALDFERDSGERLHGVHGGLTEDERKHTTLSRIDGTSIHREDATNEQGPRVATA